MICCALWFRITVTRTYSRLLDPLAHRVLLIMLVTLTGLRLCREGQQPVDRELRRWSADPSGNKLQWRLTRGKAASRDAYATSPTMTALWFAATSAGTLLPLPCTHLCPCFHTSVHLRLYASAIFPVSIDAFSPNFCDWCILGQRHLCMLLGQRKMNWLGFGVKVISSDASSTLWQRRVLVSS